MKRIFPEDTDPAFQRVIEEQRTASRKQMILAIAEGRAKVEKREAAKQAQQNPRIAPSERGFDGFQAARERLEAAADAADAIMAQMQIELDAISKHFALKRRDIKQMQLARKILGEEKFQAARLVAAARKKVR